MIQPEAYYAAHKEAPDPLTLGRIGFALVGREEELDPPLTTAERFLLGTILRCNKWHNDNRVAIKEKWKKDKQRQRSKDNTVSTDVHQCPQDNGGQTMSTTSLSLTPSLTPSLTQTNTLRTDPDVLRDLKAATGSDRFVKVNVYAMSDEDFFGAKYPTILLFLNACGKGFWAKAIRQLGEARCLEELNQFVHEVRAGEEVSNPGAVMTERLKKLGVK